MLGALIVGEIRITRKSLFRSICALVVYRIKTRHQESLCSAAIGLREQVNKILIGGFEKR